MWPSRAIFERSREIDERIGGFSAYPEEEGRWRLRDRMRSLFGTGMAGAPCMSWRCGSSFGGFGGGWELVGVYERSSGRVMGRSVQLLPEGATVYFIIFI